MNWFRKQSLASVSASGIVCLAALSFALLAGCGGDKSASLPAASADTKSDEKTAPTAAPTEPASTAKQDNPTAAVSAEKKKDGVELIREDVHTTYFPDKTVYIRREVKLYSDNSLVNHGLYTEYRRKGEKLKEGKYVDGVLQGPWQMWYDNGKLAKTENYVNGKLDGRWTQFDANGVRQDEVEYKAGKREGKQITYYPDGKQVKQEEEYHNGKLDGTLTAWHPNGTKGTEAHYKNGEPEGLQQQWYDDGKPAKQATYLNGKLNGKSIFWNLKGEKTEIEYADGKRVAK